MLEVSVQSSLALGRGSEKVIEIAEEEVGAAAGGMKVDDEWEKSSSGIWKGDIVVLLCR